MIYYNTILHNMTANEALFLWFPKLTRTEETNPCELSLPSCSLPCKSFYHFREVVLKADGTVGVSRGGQSMRTAGVSHRYYHIIINNNIIINILWEELMITSVPPWSPHTQ